MPSSSSGWEIAESFGLVRDSTTGPSNVIKDISLPIVFFNSTHAWITPTLEYSVEQIIHLRSGLSFKRSKVIFLECDGSSKLVVLYKWLWNFNECFFKPFLKPFFLK